MFEREIKFIYDFNLNKVNRLGPYFTFEQLLASDIHPAILQYISAEIDYLIYEDRQKLLKNSLFDYSGEKISFHFNQISEEAKKSKRFAQEYIAKLILHASSFTINYLVRPKWTLTKFVFDEENTKSTNDIKQILNYVYYYKYVNKILVSYINSKKILSMNAQEFEELLNKADKLGVETYLPAILTNALKSMAEFFNIGEVQKAKIPLSAVEMFLEEKELIKHLQRVNETFGNEEGVKFNLSDYQKVFNNIVVEKEELIVEPEEPQKFETEEVEEERQIVEELEPGSDEIQEENIEIEESPGEIHGEDQDQEHEHEQDQDQEHEQDQEQEHEQEDEEPGEEIIISQPMKLRIKINEDNRIEPVIETSEEKTQQPIPIENDDEELDESDEIVIGGLSGKASDEIVIGGLSGKASEENENDDKPIEEIHFQNELKLAVKEFEEDEEEDESFLQSLRDQKNIPVQLEENDNEFVQLSVPSDQKIDEIPEPSEVHEESYQEEELKTDDELERVIFTKQKNDAAESDQNKNEAFGEQPKMDMAEILEHKEMTKIIEVIFDYDIEDFATTLDEISNCKNEDDAHLVINSTLTSRHINRSSKEAQAFRSIISEYFSNK